MHVALIKAYWYHMGVDMKSYKDTYRFKLTALLRNISRGFEAALRETGLVPKHFGVLLVVGEHPGITQKDAAAILDVDRSSMGKFIDILENKRYLVREEHPEDSRAYRLSLTAEGEAATDVLWKVLKKAERRAVSGLSDDEKRNFDRLLDALSKSEGLDEATSL